LFENRFAFSLCTYLG